MSDYDRQKEEERWREDERRREEERRRQNQRQGGGGGGGGGGGCVCDPKYYSTQIGIYKIVAWVLIIVAAIAAIIGRHYCNDIVIPFYGKIEDKDIPENDFIAKNYNTLSSLMQVCFGFSAFLIFITFLFLIIMFILGFFLKLRNDRTWKKADKFGHLVAGIVAIVAAVLLLLHWICFLAVVKFRFDVYGDDPADDGFFVSSGWATYKITGIYAAGILRLIFIIIAIVLEVVGAVFSLLVFCAV